MSLEPVKTPNPTDGYEWVTYADGKEVLRNDRSTASQTLLFPQGFGKSMSTPPSWSARADGSLHILASSPNGIKHTAVTPGPDTSLAMLLAASQNSKK
jgi:hypothetical protein